MDELNILDSGKKLSDFDNSPYYDYFSKMDLPEEEIVIRIETAEAFEEEFILILALSLVMYQQGKFDEALIREKFNDAYKKVGEKLSLSETEYLLQRSERFSYDVAKTTSEHIDSEYYTSIDRAMNMSETESNVMNNYRQFQEAEKMGFKRKEWRTMLDKRVRNSHKKMEGKVIGLYEYFDLDGYLMSFPSDATFDPPASLIVGCRCSLRYLK